MELLLPVENDVNLVDLPRTTVYYCPTNYLPDAITLLVLPSLSPFLLNLPHGVDFLQRGSQYYYVNIPAFSVKE